jgi:putative phage-type endonuclease
MTADLETSLATPTSVLVSQAAPETPEWFAQRRAGITATDLPKILGLSRYGNALSVWLDKRGELPAEPAGEAAHWGHLLEDPVAQEWARRNGASVTAVGTVAHAEYRWQRASLDRIVLRCPDGDDGSCPLEVKTRSAFLSGQWHSEVPDDVLAQVTWQMLVTGYSHVHLAVLIGGQNLRSYRVDRDGDVASLLLEEAGRVWRHVLDGTPPQVDADEVLLKVLEAAYPDRAGEVHADAATVAALVADYDDAAADEKDAKTRKDAAKAALVALMGSDGDRLVIDGLTVPAVTFKASQRAGYTVAPTTCRQLRIDKAVRAADLTLGRTA